MRYFVVAWFIFVFCFFEATYAINDGKPKKTESKLQEEKIKPTVSKEEEPKIHPECKYFRDGKKARFEDIKPGMDAIFTVEDGLIIKIRAFTIKGKNKKK